MTELLAHISRGDGAWLVSVTDIGGDGDEFHHAFGSLIKAKRFAQREYGVGPFHPVTEHLFQASKEDR